MDWSDLQFLLAVHRHGSIAAAARALRVNPTTVGRRLASLEAAVGSPLFRQAATGRAPSEVGERLLAIAAETEQRLGSVERDVVTATRRPSGLVRLTTVESLATHFVAPRLHLLRERYPEVVLEILTTTARLDLARGEADIALRLMRPTQGAVVARKVGTLEMGLYASRPYLEARGLEPSRALARPEALEVIAYAEREGPIQETSWIAATLPQARVALRTGSVGTVMAASLAGVGVGVLPCRLAERQSALVRLGGMEPPPPREVWQVVPPQLARVPRIRAVSEFLSSVLAVGNGAAPRGVQRTP